MISGKKGSAEQGIIDTIYIKNVFGTISKIGFKSCDQGREKFQGTSLDYVWFDEEPPEDIYNEPKNAFVADFIGESNIIEGVSRGVDLFDCVMPSRNARHGHLFTWNGIINMNNAKYATDDTPIDTQCNCPTCQRFSRAYLHHLFKAKEMLAMRLAVIHNLYFYNNLMKRIRDELDNGTFTDFKNKYVDLLDTRI